MLALSRDGKVTAAELPDLQFARGGGTPYAAFQEKNPLRLETPEAGSRLIT